MFESKKKILVLAPHTDDGEFGCGDDYFRNRRLSEYCVFAQLFAPELNVGVYCVSAADWGGDFVFGEQRTRRAAINVIVS